MTFMLRNPPKDLWDAFKARCQAEGYSMKWVILALIRRYVEHGL